MLTEFLRVVSENVRRWHRIHEERDLGLNNLKDVVLGAIFWNIFSELLASIKTLLLALFVLELVKEFLPLFPEAVNLLDS